MGNADKSKTKLELLQEANDIMRAHIATMSHEVRTPATLVIGLSEYMIKQGADTLTEKQLQHLDSIHKNSRRLLKTFEYFHTVSRITLFPQEHEMTEVDFEEICKEAGLPSIEKNETQTIPHILSNKYFLIAILEIVSSLPYTEIEHKINLNISQNETHIILYITIIYKREIIFWKDDPRLRSCQIGIRSLEGQMSCEEPENGKLAIQIALPIFKPNTLSSER